MDLLGEPKDGKILVDVIADPQTLTSIASWNNIVCLFGSDDMIRNELLHRNDHKMILDCIQENTSDPAAMVENVVSAAIESSRRQMARAKAAGVKILKRRQETTPEELLAAVEKHFRL